MEFTAANIRAAGGIRHLCYYFDGLPDDENRWGKIRNYIEREWRGIELSEVNDLVIMIYDAHTFAQSCNLEVPS